VSEQNSLEDLSDSIFVCRKCDESNISVQHASRMNRGVGRDALIVGIEPGNTEIISGEAFSGLGGRRLMEWLISAGVGESRNEILRRVHMTSICKCKIRDKTLLGPAARNCLPYLQRQIAILNPRICVTLGAEPMHFLFGTGMDLETAVSRTWFERDFDSLFPLLPEMTKIICLPHPSPRSRWLNSPANQALLDGALARLRSEM
jgi:uracil-DNA glycosylase family 4